MKTLELASSATLPSMSRIRQLPKPRRLRLDQRAGVVGIEAAGLGVDRRGLGGRAAVGRERDRDAGLGVRHRAPRRRTGTSGSSPGSKQHAAAGQPRLGPVHRPDVERRVRVETCDARRARAPIQRSARHERLQHEVRRRDVDARAMQVEVGRDALEGAGAVEHRRAQPGRMGARPHDRHVALVPAVLEEGPGPRMDDGRACDISIFLARRVGATLRRNSSECLMLFGEPKPSRR